MAQTEHRYFVLFAMAGLAVYAVMFGGWASANKYALFGGLRSAAQTISYEVFLIIANGCGGVGRVI